MFNHENLVDQLEAARVSWKAYMESLPYPGDLVNSTPDGLYVRKHDPFLVYPTSTRTRPGPTTSSR